MIPEGYQLHAAIFVFVAILLIQSIWSENMIPIYRDTTTALAARKTGNRVPNGKPKVIVFAKQTHNLWSAPIRSGKWKENCDFTNCEVDMENKKRIRQADAIVYPLMFAPDQSQFWRRPEQRYVMMALETPTGKPNMNEIMKHTEKFYNLTMTFKADSDIPDRTKKSKY